MTDYTPALSQAIDNHRKIFHGNTGSLFILDYAPPGQRGYVVVAPVESGWTFESGKEPTDPIILQISESDDVTREYLNQATVFALNSLVYKIVDDGRKAPTYPTQKVWKFFVMSSGEAFV